jgi:hypothetical protein
MTQRINYLQQSPKLFKKFLEFSNPLESGSITHLSATELSDLTFIVMSINAWNRVNVGFRTVPGEYDHASGLEKAKLN